MSKSRTSPQRPSGAAWLGDVPSDWGVLSGRRVFEAKREAAREGDEQLSATQRYGVVPQREFMQREDQKVMLALSGVGNFKHVERDDFVISLRSFEGGIEHSAFTGCVSPAYTVLRLRNEGEPSYFRYLLKSGPYVAALQSTTDSLRDGKSINYEQFGAIPLPLPPVTEQIAIASFLDRETGKIDALVEEQRRLIELLKEKRQAVISHAVTKGLDPNARMRPSGVEWLGDVPEHWDLVPLKFFAEVGNGSTPNRDNPDYWRDGTYPWLNSSVVNADEVTEAEQFVTERALEECHLPIVRPPAILVGITGQGRTRGMATLLSTEATINQHIAFVRPTNSRTDCDYLLGFFEAAYEPLRTDSEAGSTKGAITCEQLSRLIVPLPPVEEQEAIKAHLTRAVRQVEALAAAAEAAAQLLLERRAAIISAAVTGQIDVQPANRVRGEAA